MDVDLEEELDQFEGDFETWKNLWTCDSLGEKT
jgi:hypothetical protein